MSINDIFSIAIWDFETESVFKNLPFEELELLTANRSEQVYEKGEIIFREGTFPQGIFYITDGKVKKFKVDKEGREIIIYVAHRAEIVGYHAVLAEDRYPDSAAALERSIIAFIPKDDFLETLKRSELLKMRLLKILSHEFAVLANSLSVFAQKSVRERLALQLVVLREKYRIDPKADLPVEIYMSRDDLANLVGTARENVVRVLTEFKRDGILETKGRRIIVHNVSRLIEIAKYT